MLPIRLGQLVPIGAHLGEFTGWEFCDVCLSLNPKKHKSKWPTSSSIKAMDAWYFSVYSVITDMFTQFHII